MGQAGYPSYPHLVVLSLVFLTFHRPVRMLSFEARHVIFVYRFNQVYMHALSAVSSSLIQLAVIAYSTDACAANYGIHSCLVNLNMSFTLLQRFLFSSLFAMVIVCSTDALQRITAFMLRFHMLRGVALATASWPPQQSKL